MDQAEAGIVHFTVHRGIKPGAASTRRACHRLFPSRIAAGARLSLLAIVPPPPIQLGQPAPHRSSEETFRIDSSNACVLLAKATGTFVVWCLMGGCLDFRRPRFAGRRCPFRVLRICAGAGPSASCGWRSVRRSEMSGPYPLSLLHQAVRRRSYAMDHHDLRLAPSGLRPARA